MKSILVATDGSASSKRAVLEAAALAKQAGASIAFINVIEPGHLNPAYREMAEEELGRVAATPARLTALLGAYPRFNLTQTLEAVESNSQAVSQLVSDRVLDEAERVAVHAGISGVKKISAMGDAAKQIVNAAEEEGADLVVLGRRGLSEVAELLLGSVSQKVLHRSSKNVLVIS